MRGSDSGKEEGGFAMFKSIVVLLTMFSVVLMTPYDIHGVDVGVLIDVSGSLAPLPAREGKEMIRALIIDGKLHQDWVCSSYNKENEFARNIIDGPHRAIIQPNDLFLFMEFGSKRSDKYPYFDIPTSFQVKDMKDIQRTLNLLYPTTHKELFTYDNLAYPVASDFFKKEHSSHWLLIVLSDFQSDYNKDQKQSLTEEQRRIESEFLTQHIYKWNIPIIVHHKNNNMLQMRIYDVILPTAAPIPGPSPPPTNKIVLLGPLGKVKEERPLFRWTAYGGSGLKYYEVKCSKSGNIIFENKTKETQLRSPKSLKDGNYEWIVKVHLQDGNVIYSPKGSFEKRTSPSFGLLIIVLLILGGCIACYWRREEIKGWLKKKTGLLKNRGGS
jgi:hypothetical protein